MAAPLTPAGVKVQGQYKKIYVPTLSLTAPSVAAATAADALEVTNIWYADSGTYQTETNIGTAPRRIGTAKTWQIDGETNESFTGALRYVVNPQAAAGSDGKKAYEKFPAGTTGFVLHMPGVPVDTNLAVGQFGFVVPTKFLVRYIDGDVTNEFAEFAVVQQVIPVAPGAGELVALVA
jgi:hypothetical protein